MLIPLLCIAGYVGYMSVQYDRIDDNVDIATEHNTTLSASRKDTFTIATYNIKPLAVLNRVLQEEYEKGNYVIVGGDFYHDIANSIHTFQSGQKTPDWV